MPAQSTSAYQTWGPPQRRRIPPSFHRRSGPPNGRRRRGRGCEGYPANCRTGLQPVIHFAVHRIPHCLRHRKGHFRRRNGPALCPLPGGRSLVPIARGAFASAHAASNAISASLKEGSGLAAGFAPTGRKSRKARARKRPQTLPTCHGNPCSWKVCSIPGRPSQNVVRGFSLAPSRTSAEYPGHPDESRTTVRPRVRCSRSG